MSLACPSGSVPARHQLLPQRPRRRASRGRAKIAQESGPIQLQLDRGSERKHFLRNWPALRLRSSGWVPQVRERGRRPGRERAGSEALSCSADFALFNQTLCLLRSG